MPEEEQQHEREAAGTGPEDGRFSPGFSTPDFTQPDEKDDPGFESPGFKSPDFASPGFEGPDFTGPGFEAPSMPPGPQLGESETGQRLRAEQQGEEAVTPAELPERHQLPQPPAPGPAPKHRD